MRVRRIEKPWGYEMLWARTKRYAAKILVIGAGHRLSLQHHRSKDETLLLLEGEAVLELEEGPLGLCPHGMERDRSYRIYPGQRHRVTAITDVRLLEVSTPRLWDVVRWEDDYGRAPVPADRARAPHAA